MVWRRGGYAGGRAMDQGTDAMDDGTLVIGLVSRLDDAAGRRAVVDAVSRPVELRDYFDDRDGLAAGGGDVEVVYGNVRPHELERLPRLRWVHATWSGVENLLYPAMVERGVLVTNTRGQVAGSMAEHGAAAVMYLARDFAAHVEATAAGRWRAGAEPRRVAGSRAVVLGAGAIGGALIPKLGALGVSVVGVNSDGRAVEGCERTTTLEGVGAYLGETDWLIVLLPATSATRRVVDEAMLRRLKRGAGVVNLSRGSVVDGEALLGCVREGRLRGAVLDVTDPEPLPAGHAMWGDPRILVTGHRSWAPPPAETAGLALETFVENLRCYEAGRFEAMVSRVDPTRGY